MIEIHIVKKKTQHDFFNQLTYSIYWLQITTFWEKSTLKLALVEIIFSQRNFIFISQFRNYLQTQKRKFVILTRLRLNSSFNSNTTNEKIFTTSSEMTKKTRKTRKEKIFHSTLSESSKEANKSLSFSSTLSTFDKLHRITRLKKIIDLSIAKRRNVMYSSLLKTKRTSSLLKRFQNQTIKNNNNVKLQLKTNLNYNFENFDENEKKKSQTLF